MLLECTYFNMGYLGFIVTGLRPQRIASVQGRAGCMPSYAEMHGRHNKQ